MVGSLSPRRFFSVTGKLRHRMVEIIADNPGLSGLQIIERLYRGDPNGGPNSLKVVAVAVIAANKQLAAEGYRIVGSRGRGGGYKLTRIGHDDKLALSGSSRQ